MNKSRDDFADELRGFALLGIILVNVPFLGISLNGFVRGDETSLADRIAEFAVFAFFQAKFYLLFAFLFGYSAHLMLSKPGSRGAFARRLLGLGALDILHASLLFVGDILLSYAVLGLFMLRASNWTDRRVIVAMCLALLFASAMLGLLAVAAAQPGYDDAATLEAVAAYDQRMRDGSFLQTVQARLQVWPILLLVLAVLNWGLALACFFAGLLAARRRLFADPERFSALWILCSRLGSAVGLPLSLVSAWLMAGPDSLGRVGSDARTIYGTVLGFAAAPFLSAGYVAWMVLLRRRFADSFSFFRLPGRMSLTLYIGESAVLAIIFCGWGGGLFGTLGTAWTLAIALAAWLALEVFARIWLSHFSQGPLEYLLKRVVRPTA
jgi:uncharacterized protein